MKRPATSLGFTLVEILVAVVISLFLIAGAVQMYVANKQTYRFNDALARMQENGRYALERMGSDLRMAGFWGCSRGEGITNHVNPSGTGYSNVWHDFASGLEGRDSPSGNAGDPDEITIKGAGGTGMVVQGHGSATNPITVAGSAAAVEKGICGYTDCLDNTIADIVLVSNCKRGDIFQVTSLTSAAGTSAVGFSAAAPAGTPGNEAGTALSDVYDATATLHALRVATYDISTGTSGDRGLFLREGGANAAEVVEGVENMQVAYGEDTDGDGTANRYVPRSNVADMGRVVSVRISLLLASAEDGLTDTQQAINFDGATVNCPSRHICQVMSSTFTLRNRAR
jgi:type IV pilus assembly protein PilW